MTTQDQSLPPDRDTFGRTGWDAASSIVQSKIAWIFLFSLLFLAFIWLFWDTITLIPLYAVSSVVLSLFWYQPISNWLSQGSTFIEVWDDDTNTLTTYMVGKDALLDLKRTGITNTIQSLAGNNRIFASSFNIEEKTLETSWVHTCDPWTYHRDRRTLSALTNRMNEVLHDITQGEMLAQIEGRIHARQTMTQHYQDLDSIFFGNNQPTTGENNGVQPPEPSE